ncbi:MAG: STT3 domain-containing protein, partial [Pyrobaculum sp.]
RLFPIYGNASQYLPWIFEGLERGGTFISFRDLKITGGNVYLPVDIQQKLQGLATYVIQGWTQKGVEVVVDPLTGRTEDIPFVTTPTAPLRLVYVSKPHGWVVVYQVTS